ncbi:glucose sorbosone dehydrogenase [Pseudomassariella vexata]|uniref:Glucose sorbosone dehydrogenase n=1 Tax=Pseudomassariella vexata TaxID=1141098 RepID=A0A1Y2DPX5_9PEZI|nr:glucose sorbosone dehydrogenase [Pseudomassariella vexata]ORY61229.1 glucose sorbosone dehydrogenase [Pseudomassariella vexata]
MRRTRIHGAIVVVLLYAAGTRAQQYASCNNVLKPAYPPPVVGSGWVAQLIANNLNKPRGIIFDDNDNLLVVERGVGIRRLIFHQVDNEACLSIAETKSVTEFQDLNHGIALSNDGKTLFASSTDKVYAWAYNASSGSLGDQRTVVQNMNVNGNGHVTRTLLMSSKQPGMLLVSKGSGDNVDDRARDRSTGVSQIRAFNMSNLPNTPYDYASEGTMLGWGLRNSVGVAEEPITGGIFSVENSVDQITRDGTDIHQDNPGEEMNFHGFLNGSTDNQGGNYGYPDCYALWDTDIPDVGSMGVGSQFSQEQNATLNDTTCSETRVAPRLTFQAHMAPLDMTFNSNGTEAYVTFHGSWDRDNPSGYKVSSIQFANGQPVAPFTSTESTADMLSNADNSACPDSCFRPVGLAIDTLGRVYMSSDTTGEIYIMAKAEITALGGPSPTTSSGMPSATDSSSAGHGIGPRAYVGYGGGGGEGAGWGFGLTALACFVTGLGAWAAFPVVEPRARRA